MEQQTEVQPDGEAIWAALEAEGETLNAEVTGEEFLPADPEPAAPEISSEELMSDVVLATSSIFAPNWEIQPEEANQLGSVYGKLLDKYLPDSGLDKYGLEISAVVVTGMIIKSRAGIPLRKPEPKEKAKDKAKGKPDAGEPAQPVDNASESGVL